MEFVNVICDEFETLALANASFGNDASVVVARMRRKVIQENEKLSTTMTYAIDMTAGKATRVHVGAAASCETESMSPSGKHVVVCKVGKAEKEKLLLQCGHVVVDLSKLSEKVYTDSTFGGLVWSPNEELVALVCERKPAERKSPFEDGADGSLDRFVYEPSWGEKYDKIQRFPTVLVVDVVRGRAIDLFAGDGVLDDDVLGVGQPCFVADDALLCVAACPRFNGASRKLGAVYCVNRETRLLRVGVASTAEGELVVLRRTAVPSARAGVAYRWPRRTAGDKVAFLCTEEMRFHHSGSAVDVYDAGDGSMRTVLQRTEVQEGSSFCGLYVLDMVARPFVDEHTLCVTTLVRSIQRVALLDIRTGAVRVLSPPPGVHEHRSMALQDVAAGALLVSVSSLMTRGSELWVHKVGDNEWIRVGEPAPRSCITSFEVCAMAPTTQRFDGATIEYILAAGSAASGPVVLFPHGGPHSCMVTASSAAVRALVRCGYRVALVNYRGSIGFGERNLTALPGHCGTMDVNDCMDVAKALGVKSVYLAGGSHGGFLVAHLCGALPAAGITVRACAMRNPVVDASEQFVRTDIADWCVAEFTGTRQMSGERAALLEKMRRASPIARVEAVAESAVPILMMLGADDQRVPPEGGVNFMRRLVECGGKGEYRTLWFEENGHSLDEVKVDGDVWLNTLAFFEKHKERGL